MAAEIERRPAADGVSTATFPAAWGKPPERRELLADWIERKIADGVEAERRGQIVPWLAERRR